MNKLFVYGIFLDESARNQYGMTNPSYDTVKGYVTLGNHIVAAYEADDYRIALSGLVVDIDPAYWDRLDALERGYQRIRVTTTGGETAFMYVGNRF